MALQIGDVVAYAACPWAGPEPERGPVAWYAAMVRTGRELAVAADLVVDLPGIDVLVPWWREAPRPRHRAPVRPVRREPKRGRAAKRRAEEAARVVDAAGGEAGGSEAGRGEGAQAATAAADDEHPRRALFPGYVLAAVPIADLPRLARADGVLEIVRTMDGPIVVPAGAVAALRARCGADGMVTLPRDDARRPWLTRGAAVRVLEGALAGFVGEIERLDGAHGARVLMTLFGRSTLATVACDDLAPADAEVKAGAGRRRAGRAARAI